MRRGILPTTMQCANITVRFLLLIDVEVVARDASHATTTTSQRLVHVDQFLHFLRKVAEGQQWAATTTTATPGDEG